MAKKLEKSNLPRDNPRFYLGSTRGLSRSIIIIFQSNQHSYLTVKTKYVTVCLRLAYLIKKYGLTSEK